jgi:hypothetical protein
MGLMRLIIIFIIGYFFYKLVKRLLAPKPDNPHVQGKNNKPDVYQKRNDIQDIDYEDVE